MSDLSRNVRHKKIITYQCNMLKYTYVMSLYDGLITCLLETEVEVIQNNTNLKLMLNF